jgi:hypothetical protein
MLPFAYARIDVIYCPISGVYFRASRIIEGRESHYHLTRVLIDRPQVDFREPGGVIVTSMVSGGP